MTVQALTLRLITIITTLLSAAAAYIEPAQDAIAKPPNGTYPFGMDIKRIILPQQRQRAGQTLGVH